MVSQWYKDWFASKDYLEVYKHRNFEDADSAINLILDNIQLSKDSKILDAACGAGRHSIILRKLGYQVVGFDLSKTLLKVAKEDSIEENLKIDLINADIRTFCSKIEFDLIINLFTSFGYFESDEENFAFVKHSYKFLTLGGYYVLDFLNKDYVIDFLIPFSEKKVGNKIITEERIIKDGRVKKRIAIKDDSEENVFEESVRLYCEKEIIQGFGEVGYEKFAQFGDYYGNPFTKDSERLIIIFQK